MALHPILTATIQTGILGAFSNILAQAITAFRNGTDFSIDWVPVLHFLLFSVISTPPNFVWQDFLESTFPAHPKPAAHPKKSDEKAAPPQLSIRNTLIKFVLDQTVGAVLNTLLFTTFTHAMRQALRPAPPMTSLLKAVGYWTAPGTVDFGRVRWPAVWAAATDDFWPIFFAAWKLWPAVSLLNFTLVKTVEGRNLIGGLAGVGWGVYMSLVSAN